MTYALVFILLVTAVMQIRYVNKALQRFDSTQVIPIQFVLFTLCVIVGSAILYRDFEKTTPKQAACFVGGCLLTFFGVFLITSGRQQKEKDDEDLLSEIDGGGENIVLNGQEEALHAQESQNLVTPKSQSRRSSGLSRVSFADAVKPEAFQDRRLARTLGREASGSTPHLVTIETPSATAEDPWQETWSSSSSPLRVDRTLCTNSAAIESALMPMAGSSNVSTPMRDADAAVKKPSDLPVNSRPGAGASRTNDHHRSKTFISPSPLSSTVTTVVKDAFLRNNDRFLAHGSSLRRIRSSIRASLFFNDDFRDSTEPSGYAEIPTPEALLARPRENSEHYGALENDPPRRQSRSISDALSDFFRFKSRSSRIGSTKDVEEAICQDAQIDSDGGI